METQQDFWAVGTREYMPGVLRIRVERIPEGTQNPWLMAGTEGTGKYVVFALIRADQSTIAERLTREAGWKQPGDSGQDRFSITCSKERFPEMFGVALDALCVKKAETREVNPDTVTVGKMLGVNAHGQTGKATVMKKLIGLAAKAN